MVARSGAEPALQVQDVKQAINNLKYIILPIRTRTMKKGHENKKGQKGTSPIASNHLEVVEAVEHAEHVHARFLSLFAEPAADNKQEKKINK